MRINSRQFFPTPMVLAVGLALGPTANAAQLEEVIVTAQKRAESLQDVPVAVTAIDGQKMNDMGIARLDELSLYTPSLTITEGPSDSFIFIRGVGSGFNKGFEQSVGTYIDGVYFGRGRSARNGMVDMERVEVLKGPQGILFGKNTIAGAINLTTRNPAEELEGYIEASYEFEETNQAIVEGAVGGYITDNFGIRVAGRYSSSDGWMKNTFNGEDIGAEDDQVTRLTLQYTPTDTLTVTGKVQHSILKQNEKASELVKCAPGLAGLVAGVDNCEMDRKTTVVAIDHDGRRFGGVEMEAISGSLNIDWMLSDELTLTSVTGFTKHNENLYLDSDYTHLQILETQRDEKFESFSQEIRLASDTGGRFEYLVGAYVEQNELIFDGVLSFNLAGGALQGSRVNNAVQDTDTVAVFGQGTWHLNEQWSVTVGARYSEDDKSVDSDPYCGLYKSKLPSGAPGCFGPDYELRLNRTDEDFSPSVTVEYNPTGDHMLYAKYSEGYKSGGFDLQSLSGNPATYQFEPEEAESFELGSKSRLLDGAMTLNLALFRNEYTNLQVSTFDGNVGFNVGNAAAAISQGLDLDVNWALSDTLTTSLSLALLDAYYDSFPDAQCSFPEAQVTGGPTCDLSDRDLQFAPDWAGHWNLTYRSVLPNALALTLATDVNFTDRYFIMTDLDPELEHGAFAKVDVRAAITPEDGPWEVALIARNIFDKETYNFGNDVPLQAGSYFKNPDRLRTVAVQARYRF
jgi:outer membrane receptor protein involved in Fe transport